MCLTSFVSHTADIPLNVWTALSHMGGDNPPSVIRGKWENTF